MRTKCDHDWQPTQDQSDTGNRGIRKKCTKCGTVQTFLEEWL